MERRLMEAARTGNVQALHQLLIENPLIIHATAIVSSENILHVAAALGHIDFAREIVKYKPDFASEVNHDGFNPLHIAAANDHVEIVRDMLKLDPDLCRLQGRDQLTPLHCAVIKGKRNIIAEMLSVCPRCVDDVNVQRETALHLAIKNNQFEATKLIVEWIRHKKMYDIMNKMDEKGNTVLHLAVWRKQRQVVELLLQVQTTLDMVGLNSVNCSGLTALDMLHIFPSEAGNQEIAEILQISGARRSRDVSLTTELASESPNEESPNNIQRTETSCMDVSHVLEYFSFKKGRDPPSEARSTLLMIATLAATATFQAGISLPGGYWQEYVSANEKNGPSTNKVYHPGTSIFGDMNAVGYGLFLFFNTLGFYLSLLIVKVLVHKFPMQLELELCMTAMTSSYNTAIVITAPSDVKLIAIFVQVVISPLVPLIMWARNPRAKKLMKRTADRVRGLCCH